MKQLLSLLFILPLFMACSSDDDPKTSGQDYTSFVFHQTVDNNLTNCVAGYKKDGKYYKLGDLGDLSKDKYSAEIRVNDNSITEVYFFTDYNGGVRFNAVYKLNKNTKNVFDLLESVGGTSFGDKTDPTKYPQ